MSKQAMTEILAAVANGEGAADTVLTTVSLGALRAIAAAEQPEVPCVVANRCAALVAKPAVVKDSLTTCEQSVAYDVVRDYPDGWVFHSADFSMAASCKSRGGRVTLVRDLAGRDWWISLPEEDKARVPLYVYGSGDTLSDAIKDAAMLAAQQQGGAE